jgi:hypothetical protein
LPLKTQHPLVIPAAAIAVSHPSWQPCRFSVVPRSRSTEPAQFASKALSTVVHPNGRANVAVTAASAVIVKVQVVVVPEQAPPQFTNTDPSATVGVAVRVTLVPEGNAWEQPVPVPQLMPVGFDVTVPVPPVAFLVTVNVYGVGVKVAVTFVAAVIETVQGPVPVQPVTPDQLVKVEPGSAVAVRITLAPAA